MYSNLHLKNYLFGTTLERNFRFIFLKKVMKQEMKCYFYESKPNKL